MDFKLHKLEAITNNFSDGHLVGRGVYGDVYRGMYNGEEIAMKRLHKLQGLDDEANGEFRSLSKVRHQNVVRFLGYCCESRPKYVRHNRELILATAMECVLCFEYMQGGSLERHISDESCDLDWPTCYKIIKGTSEGLNYLHNKQNKPILHLDLKPANILLDKYFTPKIADLGLSRLLASTTSTRTYRKETLIAGTLGYMPPEYIENLVISKKFDVFSLGVIIIKVMAGNEGCSRRFDMPSEQFIERVTQNWKRRLQGTSRYSSHILQVKTCAEIALRCVHIEWGKRPDVKEIVHALEELEARIKEMSESSGQPKDLIIWQGKTAGTDIAVADWIETVMEDPVTASLGPMAPLLRQIHSLTVTGMDPTHSGSGTKPLMEHLELLCGDLLEPEEDSSTPKWWRKEVRELLYDTEDRLSELTAAVEDACERRKRLQLPPNKTVKTQRTPLELSMPISAQGGSAGRCIVGVEEAINNIVKQLAFDDHNQKQLKVVPILGFPGVGKTTAAETLYHKYRGKFQCSAFVRVSRTPDTRSLFVSILSQIKALRLRGLPDVHDLSDGIKKHLKGKRYLIVIDDLWTASVWDIISRAFPDGDYGSRIITTTQIYDVALACCRYYPDYVKMSPLNDDQSRRLFFSTIFGSEDHCRSGFEEVSCKIVKKCAGLPLAIVTVASLLAMESDLVTVEEWEHIQDSLPSISRTNPTSEGTTDLPSDTVIGSEGSQLAREPKIEKWKRTQDSLPSTPEGLKQLLSLIYNNLPPHLHTYLLYLSMYPEGYLVRKQDLVRQWVAEGFVTAMKWRSAEEIAGSYFDELISTGMVQPLDTKYGCEVLSCTVHHMVLDLIRHKSKEMNFVITVDYLQSCLALSDEVRRLSLQFGCAKSADIPENTLISKVRSLLFSGFFECVPSLVDYLLLRVLILHIWADGDKTSFDLTRISELLELRYLKIQCNMTVNLPDEISGLKHLETLEVDASLSAVPSDIVHLKKLLHLLLPSEAILPEGLGSLTSLLTLGCFDLSKNLKENVVDLAKLTSLQDLRLTWSAIPSEHLTVKMEQLGSILERLNNLRSLTSHGAASSSQSICDDSLSSVSLLLRLLEKLELLPRICTLSRLPKWIGQLSRLAILKIEVFDLSNDDIAILKGLTSLTALSLAVLTEHAEWIVINKGFPVLKYFKLVRTAPYMTFLEGAMPKVQKLKLAFNANRMKPNYKPEMYGFKHMSSLTEISVKFGGANDDESNKENMERVFKDAFINHQNSLIFNIKWVDCLF